MLIFWCAMYVEIPHNPIHAMEFLCRSWSSSAYNFQQMFTSTVRSYIALINQSNQRDIVRLCDFYIFIFFSAFVSWFSFDLFNPGNEGEVLGKKMRVQTSLLGGTWSWLYSSVFYQDDCLICRTCLLHMTTGVQRNKTKSWTISLAQGNPKIRNRR